MMSIHKPLMSFLEEKMSTPTRMSTSNDHREQRMQYLCRTLASIKERRNQIINITISFITSIKKDKSFEKRHRLSGWVSLTTRGKAVR